jgi:hypothetical protein
LAGNGLKKADIHIHITGGVREGCFISPSLPGRPWSRLIFHRLGLESNAAEKYESLLISYLRESPIDIGIILACDAIYDDSGRVDSRTSFCVPNDFVLKVAGEHEELLPGVSVHPNRRDALDEIDRCFEAGAALVKWLPNTQGIDPSDKKYKAFYRKLCDNGIPLLSHTGFEFTMKTLDQKLGDPEKLRLALEEGATVIAAHCGVSYSGLSTRYLKKWLSLVKEYPNLYGDLAALSLGLGGNLMKKLLKDPAVCSRLVNGSDYPVPPLRTVADIFRRRNPFTRDYEIKSRLGVPDSVFYRGFQLIRKH